MINRQNNKILSPFILLRSMITNRYLIKKMVSREIAERYKESVLGVGWSFVMPILLLAVYTFVFSVIFKARWGVDGGDSRMGFALLLFTGLIMHGILADVLNRSPVLIIQNVNYVTKVVFPLEIFTVVATLSSLFHALINLVVLLAALLIFEQTFHWTIVFVPLTVLPLIFVVMGLSWLISALGVYLRDLGQAVSVLTMVLMFIAPIFYPLEAVPESFHKYIMVNPLTFIIQQMHKIVVFGEIPNWWGLGIYWVISLLVFYLGYMSFQKARGGFADVL